MSPTTIRHTTDSEFITMLTRDALYYNLGPEECKAIRERADKLRLNLDKVQDKVQELVALVGEPE